MKKVIHTDDAPEAIGTYSQAVLADKFLFISGQIGLDPATMEPVSYTHLTLPTSVPV